MNTSGQWKRVEPTKYVIGRKYGVTIKNFLRPDGGRAIYDIFGEDNVVHAGVIALTDENKIVVGKQFRPGPEKIMWEIPGGTVEKGEKPINAANRELLEETKYAPREIMPLGKVYKDGYMNATWHYFLAKGCKIVADKQKLDIGEFVEHETISIDELIDNATNARMTDVEAVFLAYEKLKKIKEKNNEQ